MTERTKQTRRPHVLRRTRRRGYTLVFFAMFLFAFMALAALVIDIGFARLTQRQMQTAADSAALEGLRFRDDPTIAEPDRDDARRQRASDFVAWHFDDDLDTTDDDGAFDSGSGQFGAGPLVEFTGGAGDPTLVASQMMSVDPNVPVYKPVMLNGSNSSPSASDFQVAIQRGVADVPEADLYSLGPAVPYLFARGSLINRQLIQRGVVVRATAIADARHVYSVGFADYMVTPPLRGLAPLALELTYWEGLTTSSPDPQTLSSGEIGAPGVVGRLFIITSSSDAMPVMVGRELPDPAALSDDTYSGYVPVFAAISDGTTTEDRVVGFGLATAVVTTGMTPTVTITRHDAEISSENAAANILYELDPLRILSQVELQTMVTSVLSANSGISNSLLAPISTR